MKFLLNIACRGYSLLECIIVMAIISILVGIGAPSFYAMFHRQQHQQTVQQFVHMLNYARSVSLISHKEIILCGSEDQLNCSASWNGSQIVKNGAGRIYQVFYAKLNGSITWQGSSRKAAIIFEPDGTTKGQQGRFVFCRRFGGVGKSIVLSRSGRVRVEERGLCDG